MSLLPNQPNSQVSNHIDVHEYNGDEGAANDDDDGGGDGGSSVIIYKSLWKLLVIKVKSVI